jgi:hypothetical protein
MQCRVGLGQAPQAWCHTHRGPVIALNLVWRLSVERLFCAHCQRPNSFPYPFERHICIPCVNIRAESEGGAEVDRLLRTLPTNDLAGCEQIAAVFARNNSRLPGMGDGIVRQHMPQSSADAQVAWSRDQFRDHDRWLEAFPAADASIAFAELVSVAREMQTLFNDYISQSEAPKTWAKLYRTVPGAFQVWVIWTTAYKACVASLTKRMPGEDDSTRMGTATSAMADALKDTPAWLAAAHMNIVPWTGAVLLSGRIASMIQLSIKTNPHKANKRLFNALKAYRRHLRRQYPDDPLAKMSIPQLLCELLPGYTEATWKDTHQWAALGSLRTAVARGLYGDLARQNKESEIPIYGPMGYEAIASEQGLWAEGISPEQELWAREDARRQLQKAMDDKGLTAREQETIRFLRIERLTEEQAANRMGVQRGSVCRFKDRALKKLNIA